MSEGGEYTGSHKQEGKKNSVVVKVGMVGDSQIVKTYLMVKYVEGTFDEDYIQTLGISSFIEALELCYECVSFFYTFFSHSFL
jgi:GTPase SAR1 family protein